MKAKTEWRVRMERQAHRDAMHRLKAAYQKLSQETEPKTCGEMSKTGNWG